MDRQRHIPAGGRVLGQPAQVTIREMQVVPQLFIEVVDTVGTIAASEPCLRITNPMSGLAVFCPCSPEGARNIIKILTPLASSDQVQGGSDGSTTVHE
jgi:hypothetical protein